MSAFLRCFRRNSGDDGEEEKRDPKKEKCKCKCKCRDSTDGKSFSKSVNISKKNKKHQSCCESDSDASHSSPEQYSALSSPTASVDPNGNPFFMPALHEHLPGKSYMPVAKDDPVYNMKHPRRGKAIIFNFDRWDNTGITPLGLSPRKGSEKDKRDLSRCLKKLDFEVEEHDNKKHLEMWAVLEKVRKEDHTDADCLVVVVMTHGEKNTIYVSDGTQIPINLIWESFEAHRCPSLAGKPKIFIVQACRGSQYDSGSRLHARLNPTEYDVNNRLINDQTDSSTFSYVIPNAADIIVSFSCPPGHYSWRHPEKGSWFIQAICKVFNQHAYDMNIQELFTTAAREVALNYESNTTNIESNNKKQVTSTSSTLIRNVFFAPKPRPAIIILPLPPLQTNEIPSQENSRITLQSYSATTPEISTWEEEIHLEIVENGIPANLGVNGLPV